MKGHEKLEKVRLLEIMGDSLYVSTHNETEEDYILINSIGSMERMKFSFLKSYLLVALVTFPLAYPMMKEDLYL
jgi:hypothetical protein